MDGQSGVGRYFVSSSKSSRHSVFQVKLTDAALKALEEFQKNKHRAKGLFKIKINGSNGEVHVPGTNETRNFKFSSSNVVMDPLSSFECLSQVKNKMVVTGPLSKKLTVLATDEVYQTTREKMALVEAENKKNSTKVIKQGESSGGPFVRKPFRPASFATSKNPRSSHSGRPDLPQFSQSGTVAGAKRSSSSSTLPAVRQHNSKPVSSSPHETRPNLLPARNNPSENGGSVKPLGNSSVANYPYKDRLIHLLAVRPYKKLELQQILERDGGSDREKKSWTSVLGQVAVFNPQDNTFSLSQSSYGDVREDWPFYTEEIRKTVLKRLREFQDGVRSSSVSPISSPSSISSASSSHSNHASGIDVTKRSSPDDEYHVPPKKQRIAHKPAQSKALPEVDRSSGHPTPVSETAAETVLPAVKASVRPEKNVQHVRELDGQENRVVSEAKSSSVDLKSYAQVTTAEQRHTYKADFNREYGEYRHLYKNITERTQIFKKLHEDFEKSQGAQREALRNQIFCEYEKLQQDKTYASEKRRYECLEKKLKHIKQLVVDFDRRQLEAPS